MLRFSIRETVWATAFVALATSWYLEYRSNCAIRTTLQQQSQVLEHQTAQRDLLAAKTKQLEQQLAAEENATTLLEQKLMLYEVQATRGAR